DEAHGAQEGLRPRPQRATRHAIDVAVEEEVLLDGEVLIEAELLRHVADAPLDELGLGGDVVADDAAAAAGGVEQAAEHADGRELARAVGAKHAEDLPATHLEGDVADGAQVTEAAAEPLRVDDDLVFQGAHRAWPSSSTKAGMPACRRCSRS